MEGLPILVLKGRAEIFVNVLHRGRQDSRFVELVIQTGELRESSVGDWIRWCDVTGLWSDSRNDHRPDKSKITSVHLSRTK